MQKHSLFLKIIIVEKLLLGVLFSALSFSMLTLLSKDMMVFTNQMIVFLNLDIEKDYVQDIVDWLTNIKGGTIVGISAGMFLLSSLNLMEAYGLHMRRRWAEWLTVIATSLFIPLELYEVIQEQTPVRIGALVINVAIVYYLAKHKELFPKKMFWPAK
ncbi:MAG: rane protein of unknown function [Deltaproteobacteria bacterium]|nr:rane protein of unknown function [Deltaproteobacteria bacterium]